MTDKEISLFSAIKAEIMQPADPATRSPKRPFMPATLNYHDDQLIFESLPIAALLLDKDNRIIGLNTTFIAMAGEDSIDGLIGSNANILVDHPLKSLVESVGRFTWPVMSDDPRHLRVECIALSNAGEAAELRLYFDESEKIALEKANQTLNEKLQKNTLTDEVTGLLNHRGMILALEPQVARSRRYNRPLTVVLVAIESTAPEKLVWLKVSHLLKDQLRWADLVGVTEENYFLVALPETSEDAAALLNDKIVQLLSELSSEEFNGENITARFGIAGWQKNDNANSMIGRATKQLLAPQQGASSQTTTS